MCDRLKAAEAELEVTMKTLKEKQDKLAAVEAKIAELQKAYDDSVSEKQKLERNIATTAGRLKRASKLTTALADEQIRWGESVEVSHSLGALSSVGVCVCGGGGWVGGDFAYL